MGEIIVQYPVKRRNKNEYDMREKPVTIPMVYVQVIAQLAYEVKHVDDGSMAHEAVRRHSYALQVLDAVGLELRAWKGDSALFRSTILNPILQRHMHGVPDVYTPSVRGAISGEDDPTIAEVTQFYLGRDPVEYKNLSLFQRNCLYTPQQRWFYGVLAGKPVESASHYDKVLANHDKLMEALKLNSEADTASDEESGLSRTEIEVIFDEGLDSLFEHRLESAVRTFHPSHLASLTFQHQPQDPDILAQVRDQLAMQGEEVEEDEERAPQTTSDHEMQEDDDSDDNDKEGALQMTSDHGMHEDEDNDMDMDRGEEVVSDHEKHDGEGGESEVDDDEE